MADRAVVAWLVDGDPAVRWQAERDLLAQSEATWQATRARVETEGWGADLLAQQDPDGQWAGGAFVPEGFDWESMDELGQPWTATYPTLVVLRELGLEPTSASARRTVALLAENCHWEADGQPFWHGETEPCINGMTVALGAYFGVDVAAIVDRLLAERLDDGGWNCEAPASVVSSFDSTIDVLEGLLEFELATGDTRAAEARRSGQEYLLERGLFRRRNTGDVADPGYLTLAHPFRWHHSVLRGLDYFRRAAQVDGGPPDPRLAEAVDWLGKARGTDGAWWQQARHGGDTWFDFEAVGQPSRWLTLHALRVLDWWESGPQTGSLADARPVSAPESP